MRQHSLIWALQTLQQTSDPRVLYLIDVRDQVCARVCDAQIKRAHTQGSRRPADPPSKDEKR